MKIITGKSITAYGKWLAEDEKSINTIEKYIRDVSAFMAWLDGKEVTKTLAMSYKGFLSKTYAPASVNSMIASLNSFFVFCKWDSMHIKMLKLQRSVFADNNRELTKNEYESLLNAAKEKKDERLYYLMQTICSCGIRVSELKFVTVEAVKEGKACINCKGKIRVIMFPEKLCRMLMKYAKRASVRRGSVFVSKNGNPLDRSYIWRMLKGLCVAAGVSENKVFPHNLRHLFARTFYRLQKDIVRLADILGHSSINTTRIYTIETGKVHQRQMQMLGLLRC